MPCWTIVSCAFVLSACAVFAHSADDHLLGCLQNATDSVVVPANTSAYNLAIAFQANSATTAYIRPRAFVYPNSQPEISSIVECAAQFNCPIVARCGGHSYEGYSMINDGIVVDLSNFLDITIDRVDQTVSVGAGNWLGRVYAVLENYGFVLPGGDCPDVGISGHTLGGGYGLLSRQLGMLVDSLLEVSLIDAKGSIRIVNEKTDSQLFWALRGAGANNFGIVTNFKFKLHPLPTNLAISVLYWPPPADVQALVTLFVRFAPDLPPHLWMELETDASGSVSVTALQYDSEKVEENILRIISDRSGYSREKIENDRAGLRNSRKFKAFHVFTNNSSSERLLSSREAFETLITPLTNTTLCGNPSLVLNVFGGTISQRTAFYHRDPSLVGYLATIDFGNCAAQGQVEAAELWRRGLEQHTLRQSFQNYVDSSVPLVWYYGDENMRKLLEVKRQYDPENLWHFPGGLSE
ncbi:hypothetical protein HDU82_002902 [Entophlyctis luteolus]|nr:hypothetical protein HDU82_002902 [Entophlyctis luteolus]